MFLQFFTSLRDAQVPVTLREYLTLMEALDADLADQTVENFYYLSRAALVKDERNLDKFDRVFGTVFKGLESLLDAMAPNVCLLFRGDHSLGAERSQIYIAVLELHLAGRLCGAEGIPHAERPAMGAAVSAGS